MRAIALCAQPVGVTDLTTVMVRDAVKGQDLLDHCRLEGRGDQHDRSPASADLLVNSSPLGMTGKPPLEIDLAPLPQNSVVYDSICAAGYATPAKRRANAASRPSMARNADRAGSPGLRYILRCRGSAPRI